MVRLDSLPPEVQFLFLYFGCEKLGLAILGVEGKYSAEDAYGHGKFIHLEQLKKAAMGMKLSVTSDDLNKIFGRGIGSARQLRHLLVHNLGPTNARKAQTEGAAHIPTLKKFLLCIDQLQDF